MPQDVGAAVGFQRGAWLGRLARGSGGRTLIPSCQCLGPAGTSEPPSFLPQPRWRGRGHSVSREGGGQSVKLQGSCVDWQVHEQGRTLNPNPSFLAIYVDDVLFSGESPGQQIRTQISDI